MTLKNMSATVQLTLQIKGLDSADVSRLLLSGPVIKQRLLSEMKDQLARLAIPYNDVQFVEPTRARSDGTKSSAHEPGLPLRQFIRGFLRDHMGLSTIMANAAADIFMKRWLKNDPATTKRYAQEDVHTREAIFDRKSVEAADKAFSKQVGPDALARMKASSSATAPKANKMSLLEALEAPPRWQPSPP